MALYNLEGNLSLGTCRCVRNRVEALTRPGLEYTCTSILHRRVLQMVLVALGDEFHVLVGNISGVDAAVRRVSSKTLLRYWLMLLLNSTTYKVEAYVKEDCIVTQQVKACPNNLCPRVAPHLQLILLECCYE